MNKFVKSGLFLSVFSALSGISYSAVAAKYTVEPVAALDDYENSYGVGINNSGHTVSAVTDFYKFPIQFDKLSLSDFLSIINKSILESNRTFGLTTFGGFDADFDDDAVSQLEDDFRQGNLNGNDQAWIKKYLQDTPSNLNQRIGIGQVAVNKGSVIKLDLADQALTAEGELSHSTDNVVNGITDNGWIFGQTTAPSLPKEPLTFNINAQTEVVINAWVREFDFQGYISLDNGENLTNLEGPANLYGGFSRVENIARSKDNTFYYAVGSASISYNPATLSNIELCDDLSDGVGNIDNITQALLNGLSQTDINNLAITFYPDYCRQSFRSNLFNIDAYLWKLNENGDVIEGEALGKLIEPHPFDTRQHTSVATAVNSSGVIVGYSPDWVFEQPFDIDESSQIAIENTSPTVINAVIFNNGEVIDITGEEYQRSTSRAFDINDEGVVVGVVSTLFTGIRKDRFFYYDMNAENPEVIIPDGLFSGAASEARAINNNGMVVGEVEFERHLDSGGVTKPRRRHGFVYDINTDEFFDLNDLTECSSKYEIVEVSDINDNGEIIATAFFNTERRDAIGEIEYDDNGEPLTENVLQAVKLTPIANGTIDSCPEEDTEGLIERQGASLYWLFVLLIGFSVFRRTKK